MYHSYIAGLGHFVPNRIVKNEELAQLMDTNDEWIQERTGIQERRYVESEEQTTSYLATQAAKNALENAGLQASDIDFIVLATLSPDYFFPGPGVLVQRNLGITEVGALDIRNQCSGFIYGISIADQYIKSGMYKNILVIGAEVHSNGLDMTTRGRSVSVIFGDGAGAVVLSRSTSESKILSTHLHAQGEFAEELYVKEPGFGRRKIDYEHKDIHQNIEDWYPYMNGSNVFKHAVTRFAEVIMEALNANNLTANDVSMLIPHQANLRITQFIQKKMGFGDDRVHSNIQKYGNTTAASIPLALSEAVQAGKVKRGDLVCLAAFGSGFTWGSCLMHF